MARPDTDLTPGFTLNTTVRQIAPIAVRSEPIVVRPDPTLAIVAHELRQPLAVLTAVVEVLLRKVGVAENPEIAAIARRQVLQLTRLLDDLSESVPDLSGAAIPALLPFRIDARELLRGAASDAASATSGSGQFLAVDAGSEPIWIDGDRQRLQQVLSNLLNNAIHFGKPGGRISMSLTQTAAAVTIRVSDTGRGMDQQEIPRMFDLFWRSQRGVVPGLGIGLSVVRDIVELHHGRIEATSSGLGRGSEFTVTLPAGALEVASCPS